MYVLCTLVIPFKSLEALYSIQYCLNTGLPGISLGSHCRDNSISSNLAQLYTDRSIPHHYSRFRCVNTQHSVMLLFSLRCCVSNCHFLVLSLDAIFQTQLIVAFAHNQLPIYPYLPSWLPINLRLSPTLSSLAPHCYKRKLNKTINQNLFISYIGFLALQLSYSVGHIRHNCTGSVLHRPRVSVSRFLPSRTSVRRVRLSTG
jgi:hypothetical protein